MELPLEIHKHIWDSVRRLVYMDRYNRVISDLKRFVEDQRRDKYYISKRDPDNQSMFMYLNFTIKLDYTSSFYIDFHDMWMPYLEDFEWKPLHKPTLNRKLKHIYNSWYYWFYFYYYYYSVDIFIEVINEYLNLR